MAREMPVGKKWMSVIYHEIQATANEQDFSTYHPYVQLE